MADILMIASHANRRGIQTTTLSSAVTDFPFSIINRSDIVMEVWGAGGGGAFTGSETGDPFQGGGGGAFCRGSPTNTPDTILVTIKSGGVPQADTNPGITSITWDSGSSYVAANAGKQGFPKEDGTGGSPDYSGNVDDITIYNGGSGGYDTAPSEGRGGGGGAGSGGNGADAVDFNGGAGGTPDGGAGGNAGGGNGYSPGGGGGGDYAVPGYGGNGQAVIQWNRFIATSAGPTIFAFDTFTDANNTDIDAHTMDIGSGWTQEGGLLNIQSNKLAGVTGDSVVYVDSRQADCTIEAYITTGGISYDVGIVFNVTDGSNLWLCQLITIYNGIRLYSRSGGTWTEEKLMSTSITTSTTYKLSVVINGDDLDFYLDDVFVDTFNAAGRALKTNTKHGIRLNVPNDSGSLVDDFKVTD